MGQLLENIKLMVAQGKRPEEFTVNLEIIDDPEIMADAVANVDVPLKDTSVGKFLYESGYTGRRTTAKIWRRIPRKAINKCFKQV